MASKANHSDDEPIAEINIVPFVDIILVILIIFMVTTPFIMKPSIMVNLPKAGSGDDTKPSKLSIVLTKDGQTLLNGEVADKDSIVEFATKAAADNPMVQAIISADTDVPHGSVVSVIDSVKSSGVKKFAITIDKN